MFGYSRHEEVGLYVDELGIFFIVNFLYGPMGMPSLFDDLPFYTESVIVFFLLYNLRKSSHSDILQ